MTTCLRDDQPRSQEETRAVLWQAHWQRNWELHPPPTPTNSQKELAGHLNDLLWKWILQPQPSLQMMQPQLIHECNHKRAHKWLSMRRLPLFLPHGNYDYNKWYCHTTTAWVDLLPSMRKLTQLYWFRPCKPSCLPSLVLLPLFPLSFSFIHCWGLVV